MSPRKVAPSPMDPLLKKFRGEAERARWRNWHWEECPHCRDTGIDRARSTSRNTVSCEPCGGKGGIDVPPLPCGVRPGACALYRHYDSAGALLYVGISHGHLSRLEQHSQRADWYGEISEIRIEWFESRDEALAAERDAIEFEAPLYNIACRGYRLANPKMVYGTAVAA